MAVALKHWARFAFCPSDVYLLELLKRQYILGLLKNKSRRSQLEPAAFQDHEVFSPFECTSSHKLSSHIVYYNGKCDTQGLSEILCLKAKQVGGDRDRLEILRV